MCAASPTASSDASGPDDSVRAVVDAGSEPWARILGLLERRRCELPLGSVLELHSANPHVRSPLRGWCRDTGSTLLTEEETGDVSAYRIKLPPPPAPGAPTPFTLQKPESP